MEQKIKKDLGIGLFFFLLAIAYFAGTFSIESYNPFGDAGLSSKIVPQILAVIMAVLGLSTVIQSAFKLKKRNADKNFAEASGTSVRINRNVFGKFVFAIALLTVYIFLFDKLGFIISTVLYLSAMIFLLLPRKNAKTGIFTVLFSLAVSFLVYTVFNNLLGLILPRGIFGY
ncbi:tripartite tricarboxylate transporter TctB family protein [Treponema sp. Marseille-Q4132]|uniref:tripartite tricarboxylate transporter TctB family protein n=1 Tax=Treponema sp. Marseille-Q4132 TaxID=2766701 RepID=UPI00165323CE|nr:tripartite tricarboxylate transporter TctB family protein [Treponema sp. Marseille-Q4132]QNL97792.1 tripartite tricarboxylate transporter TctB family protein [Treponema sp. Marseille-Q4132]